MNSQRGRDVVSPLQARTASGSAVFPPLSDVKDTYGFERSDGIGLGLRISHKLPGNANSLVVGPGLSADVWGVLSSEEGPVSQVKGNSRPPPPTY